MRSLVVCIFGLMPLFAIANEDTPFYLSELWNFRSTGSDDSNEQKEDSPLINLEVIQSANVIQHGDLLFNYYQRQFSPTFNPQGLSNQISLNYLHLSSNIAITQEGNFWLTAGVGLTYISTKNNQLEDEAKLSMSLGLHRKFELNERMSFNVESRVFGTYLDSTDTAFCQQQQCGMAASNNLWLQREVNVNFNVIF